eukprot:6641399-Alexandrium_andersonii.AAC.1
MLACCFTCFKRNLVITNCKRTAYLDRHVPEAQLQAEPRDVRTRTAGFRAPLRAGLTLPCFTRLSSRRGHRQEKPQQQT